MARDPATAPEGRSPGAAGPLRLRCPEPAAGAQADLGAFVAGRIEAPLVIEVGLDYGEKHLRGDIDKLVNSQVRLPYLLHLSRVPLRDADRDRVEDLARRPGGALRCAYAHLDPRTGSLRWKHVDEDTIRRR